MTRRRDLEAHRATLDEIHEIMNSMKSLAYMETRRLVDLLDAQHAVVSRIETMAADFLGFYPRSLAPGEKTAPVCVIIGSERGFCGDFNELLTRRLDDQGNAGASGQQHLIAVGHKLHPLLEGDPRLAAAIDGASSVEEVAEVIKRLVDAIGELQALHGPLSVRVLHHALEGDEIVFNALIPPFGHLTDTRASFAYPPLLNLQPRDFFFELTEHYVFAALHESVYASLMAENHRRVQHLEGAVRNLEEKSVSLRRKCNALRQEEIIEEIEVILLSASVLDQEARGRR